MLKRLFHDWAVSLEQENLAIPVRPVKAFDGKSATLQLKLAKSPRQAL